MRYYLGPWLWDQAEGFMPPGAVAGAIDLGRLPDQARGGVDRPGCLCWTNSAVLPSEYALLGEGDCREIKVDGRLRSQWQSLLGMAVAGDTLHEMIFHSLFGWSDPTGQTAPKPIMPSSEGWSDLVLPGHGRVKSERFEWGKSPNSGKIKLLLRAEFAELMDAAAKGKLRDNQHHRRVLDRWCEQFGIEDWREFVPARLQKDVPGRLKHETSYSDDFDRADSTGLGANWGTSEGTAFNVVSNKAAPQSATRSAMRYASDLSSADHYAQCDVVVVSGDPRGGPAVRMATGAATYYYGWARNAASNNRRVGKIVSGMTTALSTFNGTAFTSGTLKVDISGSTLTFYENGTSIYSGTDTSITGNLRAGMMNETATTGTQDNWSCADAVAAGVLFTQLEGDIRGIERGTYTRWRG